ncbi:hypothetical protein ACFOYU_00185 [Microvirga sp. GCM10011540]|uniref:hypothetical protein n=1 Tax=Microvirga sp. GCM10011540 TaxID=3317338 RepID=UPI0036237EBC
MDPLGATNLGTLTVGGLGGLGGFHGGGGGRGDSLGGFSIGDVTSRDGYASIGAGIDAFMDAYERGEGGGYGGGGMTEEMGGYGKADGSPSNNGPGIW